MLALVTLAVLATLMAVTMRQMTARSKLLAAQQARLQADWLARSGIEYAIARLLADPKPLQVERNDWVPDFHLSVSVAPVADEPGTFRVVALSTATVGTFTVRRWQRRTVRIEQSDSGKRTVHIVEQ